jgi:hypothetical protein
MMKKLFTIAILITMIMPICLEAGIFDGTGRKQRHQRKLARIMSGSEDVNFWSGAFGRSKNLVDCRTTVQGDADLLGVALITGAMKNGYDADQIDSLLFGITQAQ